MLETEASKVFSWRSGTRQGCLLSWLSCWIKLEVIDGTVKQEKERMEGIHIRRLCLQIMHRRLQTLPTQKLLGRINELSEGRRYKVNIENPVALLCISTEISEIQIKMAIWLTTATTITQEQVQQMNGIRPTMKNIYYRWNWRRHKKLKAIQCSWKEGVTLVKGQFYSKGASSYTCYVCFLKEVFPNLLSCSPSLSLSRGAIGSS